MKYGLSLCFLLWTLQAYAQRLDKIQLSQKGELLAIHFNHSSEMGSLKLRLQANGRLQAYDSLGREILSQEDCPQLPMEKVGWEDYLNRGKWKRIGQARFRYYGIDGFSFLKGKMDQVGPVKLAYNLFGRNKGTLAQVGDVVVLYSLESDSGKNRVVKIGRSVLQYEKMDDGYRITGVEGYDLRFFIEIVS